MSILEEAVQTNLVAPHPMDRPNRVLFGGILLVIMGGLVVALSASAAHIPLVVLGAAMTTAGAVAFFEARARRNGHRDYAELLSAVVIFGMGLLFLIWPFSGLSLLTPLLLTLFVFDGVLLVVNALTIKDGVWRAEFVAGATTIALGLVLALRGGTASLDFAATLAGLHLAGRGFMFIAASFVARRDARAHS